MENTEKSIDVRMPGLGVSLLMTVIIVTCGWAPRCNQPAGAGGTSGETQRGEVAE